MIALEEIKILLKIPVATVTYDALITALIPIITDDIFDYTNNQFTQIRSAKYSGHLRDSSLIFDSAGKTITTTTTNTDYYFTKHYQAGEIIYICGTTFNDGHYTIASILDTRITVSEALADEDLDDGYTADIYYVYYPKGLYTIFADMTQYRIDGAKAKGISSESLGDYSRSYTTGAEGSFGGYPADTMKALNKYKVVETL